MVPATIAPCAPAVRAAISIAGTKVGASKPSGVSTVNSSKLAGNRRWGVRQPLASAAPINRPTVRLVMKNPVPPRVQVTATSTVEARSAATRKAAR